MGIDVATPWHKRSYDRFLDERLPALLAERLPLVDYRVTPVGAYTCRIAVTLAGPDGEVKVMFDDIPQPDEDGVLKLGDEFRVVIPVATDEDLARAEILCVGEQVWESIAARMGQAPPELPWDERLVRMAAARRLDQRVCERRCPGGAADFGAVGRYQLAGAADASAPSAYARARFRHSSRRVGPCLSLRDARGTEPGPHFDDRRGRRCPRRQADCGLRIARTRTVARMLWVSPPP